MRKSQKGQSLVEFALTLPVLLLLLLGVVEAARVIWAYVTVQNAAREAARYAVTGQPYILPQQINTKSALCQTPEGEAGAVDPWLCLPQDRVEAIKEVALRRGRTLAVEAECTTPGQYLTCQNFPGAFGVRVTGQLISPTVSLTSPISQFDHPGTEGLNVKVETYYNVEMWDPLYDALMGGQIIQLRGEVQMQNEGVEAALGGIPPQSIQPPLILTGTTGITGTIGAAGEQIWSVSGYSILQNDNMTVHLENHFQPTGPYDVYLKNATTTFKLCPNVQTNAQNQADVTCLVDFFQVPPGLYDLYSTYAGQTGRIVTAPQQVQVKAQNQATLAIRDPNSGKTLSVWAANSDVEIHLIAHQPSDEPFDLFFEYGTGNQVTIASGLTASGGPANWRVPVVGTLCPQGAAPCAIETRRTTTTTTAAYATTDININQPEIVIAGNNTTFNPGETLFLFIRGHTPGLDYDLWLRGVTQTMQINTGGPLTADANGSTTTAIGWTVPKTWPNGVAVDGLYDISSHPVGTAQGALAGNIIGEKNNIQFITPRDAAGNLIPYITIDGGYTWPIDSFINIRANEHLSNTVHHFDFGPWRVGGSGSTFTTGNQGSATVGYRIPITAVTNGVQTTFTISSFVEATGNISATRDVDVLPVPTIRVLEGDTALPDAIITVSVTNHAPNSPYDIIYKGQVLFRVLTDPTGQIQQTYDLSNLPFTLVSAASATPTPANELVFGVPYDLQTQQVVGGSQIIATTQLTILPADLEITQVQAPPNNSIQINSQVPITLTIRNNNAVTISRYFDIDYYLDPSPLTPTFRSGNLVFPGDVKLWHNSVGPLSTFTKTASLFVGDYGQHNVFGYADTSDFLFAEPNETNNISSTTFLVSCISPTTVIDSFASLTGTTTVTTPVSTTYNGAGDLANFTNMGFATIDSASDATDKFVFANPRGANPFASTDAYVIYRLNNTAPSQNGLDVQVKIEQAAAGRAAAGAGIEIREGTANNSKKVMLFLSRNGNPSTNHTLTAAYRDGTVTTLTPSATNLSISSANPIWLRITRDANSNVFRFYYAQTASAPTTWTAYGSATVAMTANVYAGLSGASGHASQTAGNNTFDDFTYVYTTTTTTTPPGALTGWTATPYGNADSGAQPAASVTANNRLQLYSDGGSTNVTNDNSGGLLYFHKTNKITSSIGLDVMVKVYAAPTTAQWAKAGIMIRNDLLGDSDKIEFDLTRSSSSSTHLVQTGYRSGGTSPNFNNSIAPALNLTTGGPVWLRVVRLPGTDTFEFYFVQQDPMPTSWPATPNDTITLPLNDQLYIGLFTTSYANGAYGTAEFDDFTYLDPTSCATPQGQPPNVVPPGLTVCSSPLQEKSFENPPLKVWQLAFSENVQASPGTKNSGFHSLLAPSFDSTFNNPWFYQKFTMPDWISTTTTMNLSYYLFVDQLSDGADPQDRFYAELRTAPSLIGSTLVASATLPAATGGDSPAWTPKTLSFQAASGVNLTSYASQDLYLYFYNNTNANAGSGLCPPNNAACGTSKFYFDDMDLTICTTQPVPSPINTHLTGDITIHRLGVGPQKIAGVRAWAYAENGQLYETFTLQNGIFNFYNLPATNAGVKYFIYAEYYIIDPLNPNQIETLVGETTAILKTTNTSNNPLLTSLDLFQLP